jgi:hypothetical protein
MWLCWCAIGRRLCQAGEKEFWALSWGKRERLNNPLSMKEKLCTLSPRGLGAPSRMLGIKGVPFASLNILRASSLLGKSYS